MAFFGNGYFGQGFTPANLLFAQQNDQQQPTSGSFQAPQPTGSFFGSDPNLAQAGGLLSLFGTDGQQGKQNQPQQDGAPSTTPGSFFGGKREPSFEEQQQEWASIRDQVIKDPANAALLAGLSILRANRPRNGRTPGFGELLGEGGLGALQGLGQMQQMQDARRKQQMEMEMKRAELSGKNYQVDSTNGYLIDKRTGQAVPLSGWQAKPSGEAAQYLALSPEERAVWDARSIAIKQAGRPVTSVSNYTTIPYEKEFWKNEGKRDSEALGTYRDQYRAAQDRLNQYDALESLYNSGLQTGWGEETKNNIAKVLNGLGVSQNALDNLGFQNIANFEGMQNLQSKAVMGALLEQKGVQTEGDAQRAAQTWAQIGNTKEGNLWANQYAKNLAQRQIERSDYIIKETYKQGGNVSAAESKWKAYEKKLPSVVPATPTTRTQGGETRGTKNKTPRRYRYTSDGSKQ